MESAPRIPSQRSHVSRWISDPFRVFFDYSRHAHLCPCAPRSFACLCCRLNDCRSGLNVVHPVVWRLSIDLHRGVREQSALVAGNGSSDHAVHAADLPLDIDRQSIPVGNQATEDASACTYGPSARSPCGDRATYAPNDRPSVAGNLPVSHESTGVHGGSSEQGYAV